MPPQNPPNLPGACGCASAQLRDELRRKVIKIAVFGMAVPWAAAARLRCDDILNCRYRWPRQHKMYSRAGTSIWAFPKKVYASELGLSYKRFGS